MDDLIPPEVIIVGGFPRRHSASPGRLIEDATARSELSSDNLQRHSFISNLSATSLHSSTRDGRSQTSSMTSASRRGSSPSLREDRLSSSMDRSIAAFSARAEAIKMERQQAKRDLKQNSVTLKRLDRSERGGGGRQETPLSFADMLAAQPPPETPTRDQLRLEKECLKAQAKALKEEEKMRKEAMKLAKLKAAVQARNDKIDAHDRAVRERQAIKSAQRQAKQEIARAAWSEQARRESESIWKARGTDALLAKTHALSV